MPNALPTDRHFASHRHWCIECLTYHCRAVTACEYECLNESAAEVEAELAVMRAASHEAMKRAAANLDRVTAMLTSDREDTAAMMRALPLRMLGGAK